MKGRAAKSERNIAKAEKRGTITSKQAKAARGLNARITHRDDQEAAAKVQRQRGGR